MTSVLAGLPSALFISHGAPTLVIEKEEPAHKFLRGLGAQLRPKPRALVVVSAHDEESDFVVCGSNTAPYETIYDFGGFPREMYTLKYPAVGEPALAQNVYELLKKAGLRTRLGNRGLDHGRAPSAPRTSLRTARLTGRPRRHWVPSSSCTRRVDPGGDGVPAEGPGPRAHIELGRALAPLKELKDVLLVTSGGGTPLLSSPRLRQLTRRRGSDAQPGEADVGGGPHAPPVAWASEFDERIRHIITEQTGKQREDSLLALTKDPNFSLAHPRTEHIIPYTWRPATRARCAGPTRRVSTRPTRASAPAAGQSRQLFRPS
eukprot:tig00021168_g19106.t1